MTDQLVVAGSCADANPLDFGLYHVITDPPYSPAVHKNATSNSAGKGVRHRDLGFGHLTPELRTTIQTWIQHAAGWSVVFSDVEGAHLWRESYVKPHRYVRTLPWLRWSMPQLSGDRPPQVFEELILGHAKARPKYFGSKGLDWDLYFDDYFSPLTDTCLRGEGKHKCEKPLDLCLRLVNNFTSEGDTVIDPCAGSGAIGLACKLLNRSYVGFEIDGEWAEKANARIAATELSKRDAERLERYDKSLA